MKWNTADDSSEGADKATADTDYTAVAAAEVTIAAGSTTATVAVNTTEDVIDEPDETFIVQITSTNATVSDTAGEATGTITDDDATPTAIKLSVDTDTTLANVQNGVLENGGPKTARVTATVDGSTTFGANTTVTVKVGDTGDTAISGTDYTAVGDLTITIPAGQRSAFVDFTLTPTDDSLDEREETLSLVGSSGTLAFTNTEISIIDDDDPPVVSIGAAATATEGGSVSFTISLSAESGLPVRVKWKTADHTGGTNQAAANVDYTAQALTDVIIAAGSTSTTVTVATKEDALDEPDETFLVQLSAPRGVVSPTAATATGTITDDDDPPVLSIADAAATEGTAVSFTISLDAASGWDVTVDWNTAADTTGSNPATANVDYTPVTTAETVTIAAGSTTTTVTVDTTEDVIDETDETFWVQLSDATNATISGTATTATGTITDDDATPTAITLSVDADTEIDEVQSGVTENGGAKTARVTATVDGSTPFNVDTTVTVEVGNSGDTAIEGTDYTTVDDLTITIPAGQLSAYVDFTLTPTDDSLDEDDEILSIKGTSVTLTFTNTQITITDNDAEPTVSVAAATATEGTAVSFTISLDAESGRDVKVKWNTADDSTGTNPATADTDYTAQTATEITIAAGSTSTTVTVATTDDVIDEPNETFKVVLSDPTNAELSSAATATGTITDDDVAPTALTLTVDADTSADDTQTGVAENGGKKTVRVTATVDGGTTFNDDTVVTVAVGAAGDTAKEGTDYGTVGDQTITIPGGQASAYVDFDLTPTDNDLFEDDKTISLSGTSGGLTVTGTNVGIINDDPEPTLTISNASATEGGKVVFKVTLDAVSGKAAKGYFVTIADSDGANPATSGTDYQQYKQWVTIPAGSTTATVEVATIEDIIDEPNETFLIEVSSFIDSNPPGNISAVGTILDDDATPTAIILSVDADTDTDDVQSSVTEDGGAKTARVTASVDGGTTFNGDTTVTVTVGGSGDSAVEGTDYSNVGALTITIPAGKASAHVDFDLTPTDDDLDEDDETISITGSSRSLTFTNTSVTITDDDDKPVLSIADATATEGGTVSFTISLDAVSGRDVKVNWNTADDGSEGADQATADTDYTAVTTATEVTIAAGSRSAIVTVTTKEDALDEPNETFLIPLSTPTNATLSPTAATATGTITDDDDPPTLSIADATATEGRRVSFTIRLDAESGQDVKVKWATADDAGGTNQATANTDYTAVTATEVTISAGSTSTTVTVATSEDVIDEPAETFLVELSEATNATLGDDDTATGTITDDDATPTAITLSVDADTGSDNVQNSVAEDGGQKTARVTATVDGSTTFGVDKTVTVKVGNSGDTAIEGTDYTSVNDLTISIPAGQASHYVDFTLTPTDDSLDEDAETLSIKGSSGTLSFTHTQITIEDDDDPPTVSIAAASATEGGQVEFAISLDAESGRDVKVKWNTADDTDGTNQAIADTDYISQTTATEVTITAGSTSTTITVDTTEDVIDEPDETFLVELSSPTNATLGDDDTAAGTITDDDDTPTAITLSVDEGTVGEEDGAQTITVTASLDGSTRFDKATDVTVTVGDSSDTATEGTDYTEVDDFTVTIPAGVASGSKTFTLTPDDDDLDEDHETLSVTGSSGSLMFTDTAVTIEDDDAEPTLSISDATATEGGTVMFTIRLDAESGRDVKVKWQTADHTTGTHRATADTDYTAQALTEVTISAGATETTVTVNTLADVIDEPAETFLVQLSAPTNAKLSTTATATGTITDDDATPTAITLSVDADTSVDNVQTGVAEDGGTKTVRVTATVDGTTTFNADTTVTVKVGNSGDSAVEGTDYDTVADQTITISAGQSSGHVDFTLTPDNDSLDEDDETLSLIGSSGDLTFTDTTVDITDDDDPPTVSISDATATEGGNVSFTIRLNAASGRDVKVKWQTADHTGATNKATADTDYTSRAATEITIAAGSTSETVTVATLEDAIDEPDETFAVQLSAPTNAKLSTTATATGTITDDDVAPTAITLSVDADTETVDTQTSVAEGGGAKTVRVTATVDGTTTFNADTTVTVKVGNSGDSAVEGTDYDTVGDLSITISAGQASGYVDFTLTPDNDSLDEDTESLSLVGSSGTLSFTHTAITIEDDDEKPTVSISDATATEGSQVSFTIRLNAASGRDVKVKWQTADHTGATNKATADTDYTAQTTATEVTIAAGSTSTTITVATLEDVIDEPDETFVVQISDATNAAISSSDHTATGTITDDDVAPTAITLSVDADTETVDTQTSVAEGGGAKTVRVTATVDGTTTFNADTTVTVKVGNSGDSAVEGTDYDTVGDLSITISAGQASGYVDFTLTPDNDSLDEDTESLSLVGSSGTLSFTHTAITIEDDDENPTVSISDATATEGGSVSFTIRLDAESGRNVKVKWATADHTGGTHKATADTDYTAQTTATEVTIAAGSTSTTITVATLEDVIDEPDETFVVQISDATNAAISSSDHTATGTITDDDVAPTAITLSVDADTETVDTQTSVAEGGGAKTVRVTATVDGSTTFNVDTTVTVKVGNSGDTAIEGTDYSTVGDLTIKILAGQASAHVDFTLTPDNDSLNEDTESLSITGSSGELTFTNTRLSITDDDAEPTVSIAAASATEGSQVSFTIRLDTESGREVKVKWQTADHTGATNKAIADTDYTAQALTEITIAAGSTSTTVTVATAADVIDEPDETFLVQLSDAKNAKLSTTVATATGTITDDDVTPTAITLTVDADTAITNTQNSVTENGGAKTARVTATVDGSTTFNTDTTVTVKVGNSGDTAEEGTDYSTVGDLTIKILAGQASAHVDFTLTPTNDTLNEDTETLSIKGSSGSLKFTNTRLSITDDDTEPTLSISDATATEGGTVSFTIRLDTESGREVKVKWQTADDTGGSHKATADTDYTAQALKEVTITAGATTKTITVDTLEDVIDEPNETFLVQLSSPTNAAVSATAGEATGTITDDDAAPSALTLTVSPVSVTENGGAKTVTVTATVDGSTRFDEATDVAVTVGAADDTAISGTDYTAVNSFTVTIPVGVASGSNTFTLTPTNDTLDEDNETLSVTGTSGSLTVAPTSVTITDDDNPPVLSISDATATEGRTVSFTIRLDAESGRNVKVKWATATDSSDGANPATAGTDYTAVSTAVEVTIAAGSTTATVTVDTKEDVIDEPAETFLVQLTSPTNATVSSSAGEATGTITDNDAAPTSITLSVDSDIGTANTQNSVAEDGGAKTVRVTATVDGDTTFDEPTVVTVTVGDDDDSAEEGTDYSTVGTQTITIPAGSSTAYVDFTLTPTDDSLDEDAEKISIAGTSGNLTFTDTQITITDDDNEPTVSVSVAADVAEGDDPNVSTDMTFTVTLSAESGRAVTVPFTLGGTAQAGSDYTAPTTLLVTIPSGSTTADVLVPILGDTLYEGGETVKLTLGTPTNAQVSSAAGSATGTIVDDDDPPSISVNAPSILEGDTGTSSLTFTISLSEAGGLEASVRYQDLLSGTALSGTDYQALSGSSLLKFAPGVTEQTVTVTVNGDRYTEGDETVLLRLDQPVNAVLSGGVTRLDAAGIIENDDSELSISDVTVTEGETAVFTVTLDVPYHSDIQVTAVTSDGTATQQAPRRDYTHNARYVKFPAGQTSATFEVVTLTDSLTEGEETFKVTLSETPLRIADAEAIGTIADAQAPFSLSVVGTDTVQEDLGAAATFTVEAVLRSGNAESDTTITVTVGTSGDPAVSGVDYEPVTSFDIQIASGSDRGSAEFTLTPIDDLIDELNDRERVSVVGSKAGIKVSTAVFIIDNDIRGGRLHPSELTIAERDDPDTDVQENQAVFGVTLLTKPTGNVRIGLGYQSTALYVHLSTYRLLFTPSNWDKTQWVTVTSEDPDKVEHVYSNVTIIRPFVIDSGTDYDLLPPYFSNVIVRVTDQDLPPPGLELTVDTDPAPGAQTSVDENGGAKQVTVTATFTGGSVFSVEQYVQLSVGQTSDSAQKGVDYTAGTPAQITIDRFQSSGSSTFTLTPRDNSWEEDDKTLSVLGQLTGYTVQPVQITIADDDAAPTAITLSVDADTSVDDAQTSVAEDGGAKTVRVTATVDGTTTFGVDTTVTVKVGAAGDTAISGTDYTAVTDKTITIPAGQSSAYVDFTLTPNNDSLDEDDETLSITGTAGSLTVNPASVSIDDDDDP
ncbi:MAG: hypothetical protein OXH95_07880, partial [bacterium]|nr:hypothetical protein [bacterium]